MDDLFTELKRRNVFKVAVAYLVVSWLAVQVAETLTPRMAMPDWVPGLIIILLIVGFPIALLFAWAFELTPEGIKKSKDVELETSITHHTSRKIDFIIIGALVLIIGGMAYTGQFSVPSGKAEPTTVLDVEAVPPSIAVLAFDDFSPNKDQEYFADGISDEILNLLVKTNTMRVTGRTSSFSFKGKDDDIPSIAQKLNVKHVLEGSISKSGNRLKITAQLNDADGVHIWSETYKRELTDIFEIQEEIAGAIIRELKAKLLNEDIDAKAGSTTNMLAFDLYLKGMQGGRIGSFGALAEGRAALEAALELDPDFTLARLGLAGIILDQIGTGSVPPEPDLSKATTLAEMIIASGENSADAYLLMAYVAWSRGDTAKMLQMSEKAKFLGAASAGFYKIYSWALHANDRIEEATMAIQQALLLDPLDADNYISLGRDLLNRGQNEQAQDAFMNAAKISPDNPSIWMNLAGIAAGTRADFISAINYRKTAIKTDPTDAEQIGGLSHYYMTLELFKPAKLWVDQSSKFGIGTGDAVFYQAQLALLTGQPQDALNNIGKILLDDTTIHRWNSKADLVDLAAQIYTSMGNYKAAKAILIKWKPELEDLLDAPTIKSDSGYAQTKTHLTYHTINITPRMVVQLATIYRLMGQEKETQNLLRHVAYITADYINQNRHKKLTNWDHLHLAEIAALSGNVGKALGHLEKAVEKHALANWQLNYRYNVAFYSLHKEARYIELIANIENEMARQRTLLAQGDAGQ